MPRRRSPPPVDPERLTRLLETRRRTGSSGLSSLASPGGWDASGGSGRPPHGWVPETAPPPADLSWVDEDRDVLPVGPDLDPRGGEGGPKAAGSGRHRGGPRILTIPTPLRGAQLQVPWRAVVAMVVVVLVSGLFFAVRVARAEQAATPQVLPDAGGRVSRTAPPSAFASTSSSSGASGTAATVTSTTARQLVLDVVGQVAHPGLVTLPEGSRVGDVLAAAGGALPGADLRRLNLARVVTDGEQVFVPRPGETPPALLAESGGGASWGSAAPGGGSASASAEPVNLNTATLAVLDGLPGVGPVLAQRILDWRLEHGRFSTVDELGEVSGIGEKLLAQIRPKVRV